MKSKKMYIVVTESGDSLPEEEMVRLEENIAKADRVSKEDFILVCFCKSADLTAEIGVLDMDNPVNWGLKILLVWDDGEVASFRPRGLLGDFHKMSNPERTSFSIFLELFSEFAR